MTRPTRDASLNFDEIHSEYRRPIQSYLLRITQSQAAAEDLTQETFLRVHRSLADFRGDASISTWVYRIATNAARDHFRRKPARETVSSPSDAEVGQRVIDDRTPPPPQAAAQLEMSDCVQRYILRLPPTYRSVLVLYEYQGLKAREIAEVLGCSLQNAKIRLHRARAKLKEAMEAGCQFSYDERNVLVCDGKPKEEAARD